MFRSSRALGTPSAAPSIKEPLKDRSVTEGEPVEFTVKVAGNPSPTVKWFLNGKELSNSPDFQIRYVDGIHTLRISEVFDEDKGLYTLVVKNKHGEITERARLKVTASGAQPSNGSLPKKPKTETWSGSPSLSSISRTTPVFPTHKTTSTTPAPKEERVVRSGFVKSLSDKTSEAGEDIILECGLPLFPMPSKITWYKDDIEITRTIPSIRTSTQHGLCRLVIEKADTSHSGKYVCRAHMNDCIYETSMHLAIKDKLPVKLPGLDTSKYSPSMPRSSSIKPQTSSTDPFFQVSSFESSLRSEDAPRKSLDSSTDSRFDSKNCAPPQFVKKLENNQLVENSAVTFICKVSGEPAPNIQWYHNGRLIRPSSKYHMKLNKNGECYLTIMDSKKDDAGYYTCCALNVTGRDVCSAELVMEGVGDIDTTSYVEPETLKRIMMPKTVAKSDDIHPGVVEVYDEPCFSKSTNNSVTVDEGETSRLDCKVSGHPAPDLSWFKNGKEIVKGGRFQVVLNQEGMQSLVIKSVQPSDAGIYTCRAHNKVGQATMDFTLQVEDSLSKQRAKIHLSRGVSSSRVPERGDPARSSPPQSYTSTAKIFSDSTKLKMSSKQAELQRNSDQDASSAIRSSSSPMPLEHFLPRFLVLPDPVKAEEGGRAKFWAKVSGNPQPTVTWTINGLDIYSSSRFNVYFDGLMHVLEVAKVKKFDDGEVKVSARNYKGNVQHAVQLTVTEPSDLRSHLHPAPIDPSQSKKLSLSSIESNTQITLKGPTHADIDRKKNTLAELTDNKYEEKRKYGVDQEKHDGNGTISGKFKPQDSKAAPTEDHYKVPRVEKVEKPVKNSYEQDGETKTSKYITTVKPHMDTFIRDNRSSVEDSQAKMSSVAFGETKDQNVYDIPKTTKHESHAKVDTTTTIIETFEWNSDPSKNKNLSFGGTTVHTRDSYSEKSDVSSEKTKQDGNDLNMPKTYGVSDSTITESYRWKSNHEGDGHDNSVKVKGPSDSNVDLQGMKTKQDDNNLNIPKTGSYRVSDSTITESYRWKSNHEGDGHDNSVKVKGPSDSNVDLQGMKTKQDGNDLNMPKTYGVSDSTITESYRWKSNHEGNGHDHSVKVRGPSDSNVDLQGMKTKQDDNDLNIPKTGSYIVSDSTVTELHKWKNSREGDGYDNSVKVKGPPDVNLQKQEEVDGRSTEDEEKSFVVDGASKTESDTEDQTDNEVSIGSVSKDENEVNISISNSIDENKTPVSLLEIGDASSGSAGEDSQEERAREQKYISTMTEEITYKDVNNVPQKFSTRLLKTVEYTKTNSYKSSTKDEPDKKDEATGSKSPFVKHTMSEFEWSLDDHKDGSDVHALGDQYKKWKEEASLEISGGDRSVSSGLSNTSTIRSNDDINIYYVSAPAVDKVPSKSSESFGQITSYIDKATGNHLEISNKGVQHDTGRIVTKEVPFSTPIEKSVTVQDIETTDEITVETKVTQVKTVSLQLSETGDINLTETTQVQTDTDMKETKKTKEREELIVSHVISNVTEVVDQPSDESEPKENSNYEFLAEKYDLFSTWDAEPSVFVALESYEPDSDEIISLHEGEKLELIEENSEDWWYMRKFFDNRQGFVPSQLLQSKSDFDRSISDGIAQQIDKIDGGSSIEAANSHEEFPPQMMKLLTNISVHDGEPAVFECIVTSNPIPSIVWFHNSRAVKPSPDFLQFYDPDCVCSLSIREVFPEDGGRYTMVAKNPYGIASSSAELTVLENELIRDKDENKIEVNIASPLLITQPRHLVLEEGNTAKFVCKFKGETPLKISWFKDGQRISPGDAVKLDVVEEDDDFTTVDLSMSGVDETHTGKYRVLVSNNHGEAEAFTSLIVKARPKGIDFKAGLKKINRFSEDGNVKFKEERVNEGLNYQKELHSHTEGNSCYESEFPTH